MAFWLRLVAGAREEVKNLSMQRGGMKKRAPFKAKFTNNELAKGPNGSRASCARVQVQVKKKQKEESQ